MTWIFAARQLGRELRLEALRFVFSKRFVRNRAFAAWLMTFPLLYYGFNYQLPRYYRVCEYYTW